MHSRLGHLSEKEFVANQGRTPKLDAKLEQVLQQLRAPLRTGAHA